MTEDLADAIPKKSDIRLSLISSYLGLDVSLRVESIFVNDPIIRNEVEVGKNYV